MVERYQSRSSGRDRDDRRDDRRSDDRRDDRRDDSKGRSDRPKWRYEPQKAEKIAERGSRTGGRYDSIFKSGIDSWRPKTGDNWIRFLPGTWGVSVHYAYDIFIHRGIGTDDSTYLCLDKMLGKFCPICDAAGEAKRARDEEEVKALRAIEQKCSFILDREGDNRLQPQAYAMSWTLDRDIASLANDKRHGHIFHIDDPQNGYDVTIKRAGTGLNTRYHGIAIDRDPSPIAEKERDADKIMDFIGDNPIPSILNFYDADYLEKVLSGTTGGKDEIEERERVADDRGREHDRDEPEERGRDRGAEPGSAPEERERSSRGRGRDEPEERPSRGRSAASEEAKDERSSRDRGRDEPEPSRGRGRDEPEPSSRDRGRDEPEEPRGTRRGRDQDADDAPRGRDRGDDRDGGDRRESRGNGRDDPPFEPDEKRDEPRSRGRGQQDEPEQSAERSSRGRGRDEPEERSTRGRGSRGSSRDEPEDRRPSRRR